MNAPHEGRRAAPRPESLPLGGQRSEASVGGSHPAILEQDAIVFRLNGSDVSAAPGETIIQVADRLGVPIPRLCYKPGYRADGNCRACMVEIKGERVLAPSCCRQPTAGMEVSSQSERAVSRRAARLHRSAAGLELESLDQREALLVEKLDGDRVRPALTASGRVPLAFGDRIVFTDGKSPVITAVVEEA